MVSIIVTNYNYEKFLNRCLRSCMSQKNVDFEVVIIWLIEKLFCKRCLQTEEPRSPLANKVIFKGLSKQFEVWLFI